MNRSSRKNQTASEFLAELKANPAYQEMQAKRDAEMEARRSQNRIIEQPLLSDLRAAGVDATSVWDLVNTTRPYPTGVPVLLEHFSRDYPPTIREGIARALAVPEASWAWQELLSLFMREPVGWQPDAGGQRDVRAALAIALAGAATESVAEQLAALLEDSSLGKYRLPWVRPLSQSSNPTVRRALEGLRTDPDLRRELRTVLGRPRKR